MQINATAKLATITAALDEAALAYAFTTDGAIEMAGLTVFYDQAGEASGWAWRSADGSGPLDSTEELLRLAVDLDDLVSWLERGTDDVYEPAPLKDHPGLVELSVAGVALCEAHGLTIDVDAYGCAYCVGHTIA